MKKIEKWIPISCKECNSTGLKTKITVVLRPPMNIHDLSSNREEIIYTKEKCTCQI